MDFYGWLIAAFLGGMALGSYLTYRSLTRSRKEFRELRERWEREGDGEEEE